MQHATAQGDRAARIGQVGCLQRDTRPAEGGSGGDQRRLGSQTDGASPSPHHPALSGGVRDDGTTREERLVATASDVAAEAAFANRDLPHRLRLAPRDLFLGR